MSQTEWNPRRGLRRLALHQLPSFLDLGLVVAELSRDDLHSAGDFFLQAGLTLTFAAALAIAGLLDAGGVLGLAQRAVGLTRLGTGSLRFGRDGFCWEALWGKERSGHG
jgi:hypothetical protein